MIIIKTILIHQKLTSDEGNLGCNLFVLYFLAVKIVAFFNVLCDECLTPANLSLLRFECFESALERTGNIYKCYSKMNLPTARGLFQLV